MQSIWISLPVSSHMRSVCDRNKKMYLVRPITHLSTSMPIHPHLVIIMRHALARYRVLVFTVRGTRVCKRNIRPRLLVVSVIFFGYC
jgi:hypothetical protein